MLVSLLHTHITARWYVATSDQTQPHRDCTADAQEQSGCAGYGSR